MTRTLLWGAEDYSQTAPIGVDITLADDISNYDFVTMVVSSTADIRNGLVWNMMFDVGVILELEANRPFATYDYSTRYIIFKMNGLSLQVIGHQSDQETSEGSDYAPNLYKVYGIKI